MSSIATSRLGEGIWRLADPKITLASIASLILGAGAAARDGALSVGWLVATVLGVFFVEVAKNASGEIFDFDSGTDLAVGPGDRSPFSGGKRVLVDGLLTRAQTWAIAIAGYVLTAAVGVAIVLAREPGVLVLGLAGLLLAYFYHAPPLKLSYRGLGELAVAVTYGPIVACGTYLVQRGRVSASVLALSIPLGVLIAGFLWLAELPDHDADRGAGKRTLIVRLGRQRAVSLFPGLLAGALATHLALAIGHVVPYASLLGLVALAPAVAAAVGVRRSMGRTAELIGAQKMTLVTFVVFATAAAVGLIAL